MGAKKIHTYGIVADFFNDVYLPYAHGFSRPTEIFYGGSSSGKSNFIAHRTVLDIMDGGHNYLVIRRYANTVTKSVFNEIQKAIIELQVGKHFNIVPSQGHITCTNGYQILFSGMDDSEKVKSITPRKGVITDVWYEEATEAAQDDVKQLRKRLRGRSSYFGREVSKRIILSFNPIYRTHWIVSGYFTPIGWKDDQTEYCDDDISILKTTYKDNKFLTEQDCKALEDETDPYWYDVYTLGNWGVLGDSILTNWRAEDLVGEWATFDNIRNGFDFGYSSDPASYVRVHYDRKKKRIYVFSGWEQRELTNPAAAIRLKVIVGDEPLFCDSAEPKSIQELKDNEINAVPTKKGKDSVLHGIQWLQQHEIIVDSSLQHIINELTIWSWKKDKDGNSLPIPEDKNNHSIAALRYALEVEFAGFFAGLV